LIELISLNAPKKFNGIRKLLTAGISACLLFGWCHTESAHAAQPTKDEIKSEVQKSLEQMIPLNMPSKGFKLKYPKNWEESEPTEGLIACRFKALNGMVSARVAIETLPTTITLDEYSKATAEQIKKMMGDQHMPITVLSDSKTELGAVPASKSVYTYPVEGTPLTAKVLQILAIKNGKGYVFNYTAADASIYDDFLEVITEVVKSVEWI
jgi:hypothetical protein